MESVDRFFAALDAISEEAGALVKPEVRDKCQIIAEAVANASFEDAIDISRFAREHAVKVKATNGQGFLLPVGSWNTVFTVIPEGCRAPVHFHRDDYDETYQSAGYGFGELTLGLRGELVTVDHDASINRAVRKTLKPGEIERCDDGSLHLFLPQKETWVGFYVQPNGVELIKPGAHAKIMENLALNALTPEQVEEVRRQISSCCSDS